MVLYKRGTEFDEVSKTEDDVENGAESKDVPLPSSNNSQILFNKIKMEDVFSFSHVSYTIETPDGQHKRLLDDVSGYVPPGKLTALMGESGAGKVSSRPKH